MQMMRRNRSDLLFEFMKNNVRLTWLFLTGVVEKLRESERE